MDAPASGTSGPDEKSCDGVDGSRWRGAATGQGRVGPWARPALAGLDFSLWTGVGTDPKWWGAQKLPALTRAEKLQRRASTAPV